MLGKLIKHEWKGTYRMGCLMLGAMAAITFLGWLSFRAPVWKSMNGGSEASFGWLDIFSMFTVMIYAMLLACITFGIRIYLGVRFYKTMYTDEGYLTHTLPVTKNQILASKILVSGLWTLFILLSVCLSLFILVFSMVWTVIPEGFLPADFFAAVWEMMEEMESVFGFRAAHFVGMWIVASLTGVFTSNAILFGAISLGQLVPRARLLMGILFYILILVAEQMLVSMFRSFATTIGVYMNINMDLRFLIDLLAAALLYAASYLVISRKLNLA
nr:hypothetical protein [uncultured Acetatifactor sp.]